jgi:NTP pyrophosphatase (non-canonical NTP hydrolase)
MEFHELSIKIDTFIQDQGGYWDLPWILAALSEELGELSRAVQGYAKIRTQKRIKQSKDTFQAVKEESGDLLFALLCLTNFFKIDLEEALLDTLRKYEQRSVRV